MVRRTRVHSTCISVPICLIQTIPHHHLTDCFLKLIGGSSCRIAFKRLVTLLCGTQKGDMPETVLPSVRFVEGREGREADRSSAPAAFGDRS